MSNGDKNEGALAFLAVIFVVAAVVIWSAIKFSEWLHLDLSTGADILISLALWGAVLVSIGKWYLPGIHRFLGLWFAVVWGSFRPALCIWFAPEVSSWMASIWFFGAAVVGVIYLELSLRGK